MLHLKSNIICTIIILGFVQNSYEAILQSLTSDDGRIVGGKETPIQQRPEIVSLAFKTHHYCGGTIIRDNVIITAAHCLMFSGTDNLTIRAGSNVTTSGGQVLRVKRIKPHPNYNPYNVHHDIGIMILENSLKFDESVSSIKLPLPHEATPTDGQVSGWGLLAENTKWNSNIRLRTVKVSVVSTYLCNRFYWNTVKENFMFCAGDIENGGKDSCQGDSGGPFTALGKLFGIVSWGYGCARPGYPGVYTKVSSYIDWIEDTLNEIKKSRF